jgi:hypothetical protein
LQHLWATAVETVDFFNQDSLKSSAGSEDWSCFFQLVGASFACFEDSPAPAQFQGLRCDQIGGNAAESFPRKRIQRRSPEFAIVFYLVCVYISKNILYFKIRFLFLLF